VTAESGRGPERSNEPPAILVTDGGERSALAVVRSLGRAGYVVHVSARRRGVLATLSKWTRGVLVAPDALHAPSEFADAIAEYVRRLGIRVVVPVTDAAMLALLPVRDRLAPAVIPFGGLDAFLALADKAGLRERAGRLGIAFPPQVELSWEERNEPLGDRVRLPVVIKPARSVGESASGREKFGVRHAATLDDVQRIARDLPRAAYPLLIQQRIVGPGIGVFLLLWDGRLVASFAHRRIREKPPSGGVSVSAESVAATQALIDHSWSLLRDLGWCGVAMVEYKMEDADGTPYLMEINGRFWGSLQLAIDAGVDFPRLLAECALGHVPGPIPSYRTGVRTRWWWGDVDHLIARLRHSDAKLSLPAGAPSRVAAVRDFVAASMRRDGDAVWRWDDPRPFVAETMSWFRGA
jgi:predicted ATP-grasp superfamily ATP-dependent carboligase